MLDAAYWNPDGSLWPDRTLLDEGLAGPDFIGSVFVGSDPRPEEAGSEADTVSFSEEAMRRLEESALKPLQNGAYSLKSMERRIAVVRAEIAEVWGSALPDEEKYRLISAKENEIALLQAGQFEFARHGFTGTA